jgi:hypothetical protein
VQNKAIKGSGKQKSGDVKNWISGNREESEFGEGFLGFRVYSTRRMGTIDEV